MIIYTLKDLYKTRKEASIAKPNFQYPDRLFPWYEKSFRFFRKLKPNYINL